MVSGAEPDVKGARLRLNASAASPACGDTIASTHRGSIEEAVAGSAFWERIRALEEEDRNISRWMREADKRLGLGKAFVELWRELSKRWAHAGGAMRRILETVEAKGRPPS